ncbi:MAG: pentapeptide repeat-containing protein [Synechococcus sp.]
MKNSYGASSVAFAAPLLAVGAVLVAVPSVVLMSGFVRSVTAIEYRDLRYLQATGQCPQCDLKEAVLTNAALMGAQLMDADLAGADLAQASLMASNLVNANLQQANLSGANLSGADLSYADLSSANMIGAVLWDVNWNGALTEGALYSEDTVFDDSVNPQRLGMILVKDDELPLSRQIDSSGVGGHVRDRSVR